MRAAFVKNIAAVIRSIITDLTVGLHNYTFIYVVLIIWRNNGREKI